MELRYEHVLCNTLKTVERKNQSSPIATMLLERCSNTHRKTTSGDSNTQWRDEDGGKKRRVIIASCWWLAEWKHARNQHNSKWPFQMFWPSTWKKRQRTKYDQELPDDRVAETTAVAINNMTDAPVSQTAQRPDDKKVIDWRRILKRQRPRKKGRCGTKEIARTQRCWTRMICEYSTDLSSRCQLVESSVHSERTEMASSDSWPTMQCSFLHAQKWRRWRNLLWMTKMCFCFSFFCCFETMVSWRHGQCKDCSNLGATPAAQMSGGQFPPLFKQGKQVPLKAEVSRQCFPISGSSTLQSDGLFSHNQTTKKACSLVTPDKRASSRKWDPAKSDSTKLSPKDPHLQDFSPTARPNDCAPQPPEANSIYWAPRRQHPKTSPHVSFLLCFETVASWRMSQKIQPYQCYNCLSWMATPAAQVFGEEVFSLWKGAQKEHWKTLQPACITRWYLYMSPLHTVAAPSLMGRSVQPLQQWATHMAAMQQLPSVLHFLTKKVHCQMTAHCFSRKLLILKKKNKIRQVWPTLPHIFEWTVRDIVLLMLIIRRRARGHHLYRP